MLTEADDTYSPAPEPAVVDPPPPGHPKIAQHWQAAHAGPVADDPAPPGEDPREVPRGPLNPSANDDMATAADEQHLIRQQTLLGQINQLTPTQAAQVGLVDEWNAMGAQNTDSSADPLDPDTLQAEIPSLQRFPPAQLDAIRASAGQLQSDDLSIQLDATAELARQLQPDELPRLLEHLQIKDAPLVKLATDPKALTALQTLNDTNASPTDKISAALALTNSIGSLTNGDLGAALQPALAGVTSGAALADAIGTFSDADADTLDQARAALNLANAVRTSAGNAFPELKQQLRAGDSFSKTLSAALTLADPDASAQDKAQAALDLALNVPELAGDAERIGNFLRANGVADRAAILAEINNLPAASRLSDAVKTALGPDEIAALTPAQADQLAALAAHSELKDALPRVLTELDGPDTVTALLSSLDGAADSAAQKTLLDTLSGLKPGVAQELLSGTIGGRPGGEVLAEVAAKVGARGDDLAKLVREFDGPALATFLDIANQTDPAILQDGVKLLSKADSQLVGTALRGLDTLLTRAGVELTGEIAEKLIKGLTKAIPLAGAIPAAHDAFKLSEIAADSDLPPDIRFLALQGAKLNGADVVLSLAEPFIAEFGVPIAADVALALGSIGADVIVTDQLAKYNADPENYQSPAWMTALNVGLAAAQGPQGALELALIYGPEGAVEVTGQVARLGGSAAADATVLQHELNAHIVGEGLHYSAEGLHRLADVIRDPEKYGAAGVELAREAVGQLEDIIEQGGDLARQAKAELTDAFNDVVARGQQGLDALSWIASNPGTAGRLAAQTLGNAAQQALATGTAAGREAARQALAALGDAKARLQATAEVLDAAARRALRQIDAAIATTVEFALGLGEQGLDALAWIAGNPGEAADIAQRALVDTVTAGGELAEAAYDRLTGLGTKGLELADQAVDQLVAAGEAGIETLRYIAENPGAAAAQARQAAIDGLATLANGVGAVAESAADALTDLVDTGISEARATVTHLLVEGGDAAQRIGEIWSETLSEGSRDILEGLVDLGDAGHAALARLAGAGVGLAGTLFGNLQDGASWLRERTSAWSPLW